MARRYDHSRPDLRAMALDAAREIVGEGGIRALSARKVSGRIGYAVGTLYNLFENLDDLILQLNATTLDSLDEALRGVPTEGETEVVLKRLAGRYIAFTGDNLNLWNCLFDHRLPPEVDLPDWYAEKVGQLLDILEQAIAPLFDPDDGSARQASARVLWSSLHGICSLAHAQKLELVATDSAAALADDLISNYVAGVRANRHAGDDTATAKTSRPEE